MPSDIRNEVSLKEDELIRILNFSGDEVSFAPTYEELEQVEIVTIETVEGWQPQFSMKLKLLALAAGTVAVEGLTGTPPNKMFEAEAIEWSQASLSPQVFVVGAFFPNNTGVVDYIHGTNSIADYLGRGGRVQRASEVLGGQ